MMYRAQGHLAEAVEALRQVVELDKVTQHPDLEADQAMLQQLEQAGRDTQSKNMSSQYTVFVIKLSWSGKRIAPNDCLVLQTASKFSLHQCGNKLTVASHFIPPG